MLKRIYFLTFLSTYIFANSIYPFKFTFKEHGFFPQYPISKSFFKDFGFVELNLINSYDEKLNISNKILCRSRQYKNHIKTLTKVIFLEKSNAKNECDKFFKIFYKYKTKEIKEKVFKIFIYKNDIEKDSIRAIIFKEKNIIGTIHIDNESSRQNLIYKLVKSLEENNNNYSLPEQLKKAQNAYKNSNHITALKFFISAQMLNPKDEKMLILFKNFIENRKEISMMFLE
ncbi:hypothetical protein [Sulfurospirillum arcachonense]|uniref:hypothetical protein n=1 Tax=Sulfurospirillum arcachonense TaxID=57666 RepID=UPI00046AEE26|nr:hypothetical protein [Sulfurospirillum arcachonense]